MARGRRARATTAVAVMKDSTKGQLKLSPIVAKREPKTTQKPHLPNKTNMNYEKSMEITRRTRNVRCRLQQIQKQFDNHAITRFFQRTLKSSHNIDFDETMDGNACDGFNGVTESDALLLNQAIEVNGISAEAKTVAATLAAMYTANNQCQRIDIIDDNDRHECNGNAISTIDHRNSIQSANIFLQKPVLHLDIDKQSLNHTAAIVINKHSQPFASGFQTFNLSAIVSNGQTNTANEYDQLQSSGNSDLNESDGSDGRSIEKAPSKAEKMRTPRKCNKRRSDSSLSDALNNSDSNSCDSGVVSDKSFESSTGDKPTTPHRIVCTSNVPTQTKEVRSQQTPQTNRNEIGGNAKRTRGRATRRCQQPIAKAFFMGLKKTADLESNTTSTIEATVENIKIENDCKQIDEPHEPIDMKPMINATLIKEKPRSTTPFQAKQMTDFFPVRRSIRKTKRAVEQEYLRHIEIAIEKQNEDSLVVKLFKGKGRGICAGRPFSRGEFVVEYIGDLIDQTEADRREHIYARDSALGCYMYYFKHKEQQWCIDATAETGKLGRLVNHSRIGNLVTKIVTYKNRPHLVLIAKEDIKEGEELNYDYGDRTRESLINHPWLAL